MILILFSIQFLVYYNIAVCCILDEGGSQIVCTLKNKLGKPYIVREL